MGRDFLRDEINRMRKMLSEEKDNEHKGILLESEETYPDDKEALDTIPYTTNDELLNSITQVCKDRFGANFTKSKTPMLYYPKDGDITLTGEISSLNNAVFQFRYKDSSGNGCYVWLDPIHLSDDTIKTLSVINGVYKNWKNELSTSEDIKPMSLRDEGVLGGDNGLVPGDDLD